MRRKMLLSYFSILLAFCAVIFVFVLRTVYSMVQGNLIELFAWVSPAEAAEQHTN